MERKGDHRFHGIRISPRDNRLAVFPGIYALALGYVGRLDEAIEHIRTNGMLSLQPLCGGLPPELAWRSLRLVAERVMPAVSG